jgi:hypothetical protein
MTVAIDDHVISLPKYFISLIQHSSAPQSRACGLSNKVKLDQDIQRQIGRGDKLLRLSHKIYQNNQPHTSQIAAFQSGACLISTGRFPGQIWRDGLSCSSIIAMLAHRQDDK